MPTSSERLLSEFIDAWNAGQRPDVDEYLARAEDHEREQLVAEIRTFLDHARTPRFSTATLDVIRADPLVAQLSEMPDELGLWPTLLPRLRKRARLRRDDLVARLAGALGIGAGETKVARYYHGMEAGTLDPAGVSRRVLEALASILGVTSEELAAAGDFQGFHQAAPRAAFGRTYSVESDELDAVPAPASPGTPEEWDEVDQLFRGGR
jgi:hypothetical protein